MLLRIDDYCRPTGLTLFVPSTMYRAVSIGLRRLAQTQAYIKKDRLRILYESKQVIKVYLAVLTAFVVYSLSRWPEKSLV